jgi:signal transduction histidine kinase
MWATPSPSTNRYLLAAWAVFAGINVVLMWFLPGEETVPFHFVWISLSLVYGFTYWRSSWMVVALAAVVLTTGAILAHHAGTGEIRWEETTEEPLMAGIFVVMVWHVYRRQLLLREVQRIHEIERRRLERQQLFVRLASHELRTPITVARGYTELVRTAHAEDEAMQQDTAVVLDELDKVAGITQRLVTLMQLDEPHPLRRTDVDAELLRIVRRWEPAATRQWAISSTIGEVHLSPDRFEAAMDCLLENAVKFTRRGDRIRVTGERTPGGWVVHVRDSGIGISTETADSLLHAMPGQATRTGTGLGLAIVRAVVEPLGGRMTISGEIGGGTLVSMHVPQLVAEGREGTRPTLSGPAAAGGRSGNAPHAVGVAGHPAPDPARP